MYKITHAKQEKVLSKVVLLCWVQKYNMHLCMILLFLEDIKSFKETGIVAAPQQTGGVQQEMSISIFLP